MDVTWRPTIPILQLSQHQRPIEQQAVSREQQGVSIGQHFPMMAAQYSLRLHHLIHDLQSPMKRNQKRTNWE